MKNILEITLCLTHGGQLAGLYGLLATNKLSSNNALLNHGDNVFKFTDPTNEFTQENNFLFFESASDRGNLSYASLVEYKSNQVGFAFLLVASSDSLLEQVDMIGNTDGILLGRSDGNPLEINTKKLKYKILVPESYKEDILNYCENLKKLGIKPQEDLLVFKPMNEIDKVLRDNCNYQPQLSQKKLCEFLNLEAKISDKDFLDHEMQKTIETKTSTIIVNCSTPLPSQEIKTKELKCAQDLVSHMKERPTLSNLQRNSMWLFAESTNSHIDAQIKIMTKDKGSALIFDLIDSPEDLAFCFNQLAKLHPVKETLRSGEKRISSYEVRRISNKLSNNNESVENKEILTRCLDIASKRDVTTQECSHIISQHKNNAKNRYLINNIPLDEKEWFVALNRVQQQKQDTQQIKDLIKSNPVSEILVWKQGLNGWKNINELEVFKDLNNQQSSNPISIPKLTIVENIHTIRNHLSNISNDMSIKDTHKKTI